MSVLRRAPGAIKGQPSFPDGWTHPITSVFPGHFQSFGQNATLRRHNVDLRRVDTQQKVLYSLLGDLPLKLSLII